MNAKPTPTTYGDRAVYSVAGFNQGVADWLGPLGNVWVEGELSELKRTDRWGLVYFRLKDDGAILQGSMQRDRFDKIQPPPAAGDRVHAFGRGELWQRKGEFRFRAYAIEQFGLGQLLRRIEEVRVAAGAGGALRRRAQAAAAVPAQPGRARVRQRRRRQARRRRDGDRAGIRACASRIVEAAVQGGGAAAAVTAALRALDADPAVEVIVLARGGGSVEDLLAFSDEGLCRAVAECSTPVVSAIGHEQDTPLVDLVADVRAGTPSLAAKLIVPDHAAIGAELDALLARAGRALEGRATPRPPASAAPGRAACLRRSPQLDHGAAGASRRCVGVAAAAAGAAARTRDRPAAKRPRPAAPARSRRATLERGYAIVQDDAGAVVRDATAVAVGERVGVRLAAGRLGARVEEVQP